MEIKDITKAQERICHKYSAPFRKPDMDKVIGVADNLKGATEPIHGLRHPTTGDTDGWYIWAGDMSFDKKFFKPMHLKHVVEQYPELIPYLGLPPGWRFLIDPQNGHEDVWRDESLLQIDN